MMFFHKRTRPQVTTPAPRATASVVLRDRDCVPTPRPVASRGRVIVGLAGRKRCGKSTIAGVLRQHGFLEASFASPIRMFATFLLSPEMVGGHDWLDANKETPIDWLDGKTPRQVMQTLGTEWGRQMIHPDLWVRRLARMVDASTAPNFVISDVRFPNEADAIHGMGGIIVNVERTEIVGADEHVSEAGLAPEYVDLTFQNRGTLVEMRREVSDDLLPHILACVDVRTRAA